MNRVFVFATLFFLILQNQLCRSDTAPIRVSGALTFGPFDGVSPVMAYFDRNGEIGIVSAWESDLLINGQLITEQNNAGSFLVKADPDLTVKSNWFRFEKPSKIARSGSNIVVPDHGLTCLSSQGAIIWQIPHTGTPTAMARDKDGNIYVGGAFSTLRVAVGALSATNHAGLGGYVAKISPDGVALWLSTFSAPTNHHVSDIAVDATGRVHLVGFVQQSLKCQLGDFSFDPNETGFLMSLTPKGTVLSLKKFRGGAGPAVPIWLNCIASQENDLFVVGLSFGEYHYANVSVTNNSNRSFQSSNAGLFIQKIDSSGTPLWLYTAGEAYVESLRPDSKGNIFFTGFVRATNAFETPLEFKAANDNTYPQDVFVAKAAGGRLKWVTNFGTTGGEGLSLDVDENSLLLAGRIYHPDDSVRIGGEFVPGLSSWRLSGQTTSYGFVVRLEELALSIENRGPLIHLTFPMLSDQFILEYSTLQDPLRWIPISGVDGSVYEIPNAGSGFFRLRKN